MSKTRSDQLVRPTQRHTSPGSALGSDHSSRSFEQNSNFNTTLEDVPDHVDEGGEGGKWGGQLPSPLTMMGPPLILDPRMPSAKVDAYKRKLVSHIKHTRDKMRREKEARDENIASFLQNPNHHPTVESKEAFERRNQRYTEHIATYAKKLAKYESDYKRLAYLAERKRAVPDKNEPASVTTAKQGEIEVLESSLHEEQSMVDQELSQAEADKKESTNLFKKFSSHDQLAHKDSAITQSFNDEINADTKSSKSVPRIKHIPSESSDKPPSEHRLPSSMQDNPSFTKGDDGKVDNYSRSNASSSPSIASSTSNYNSGKVPVQGKENASIKPSALTNENDHKILTPNVVNVDSNQTIVPEAPSSPRHVQHSSLKILNPNINNDPVSPKENSRDKTSSSDRESDFKSQNENAQQSSPTNSAQDHYTHFPTKASSLKSRDHSQSILSAELEKIIQLQNQDRRNLESLRIKNQQDFASFTEAISEARFRSEHLDEQVSDIIELQQSETENLRLEIKALEEKMSYQVDDRTQDILEMMENIQTRVSKLELAQQRQQIVSLEGIEMSAARNLLLKSINILLAFLQLILLITSTFAQLLSPFIKTRSRTLITLVLSIIVAIILKSHPNLQKQLSALVVKIFHSIIATARK